MPRPRKWTLTIEELQSYLWNSAVLLRTNIDAGAYKQYIFPLLFFKRICDVYDEETAKAVEEYGDDASEFDEDEIHTFIVPKGYHWNDVRAVSENVGVAIVEAFRKVENANSDKLQGIFGDGAWTNKNRLPDRLLKDLLEHFSTKTLSIANCPEDELGQGYEYLIKKFADDSGHTAQEFYTNRTVVHLMTEMLKPESGESIYDPTCGSAGMLISAIAYLKEQGKEWRNVAVYGQEINALTSAIGKMNLFLHGVKDFCQYGDLLTIVEVAEAIGYCDTSLYRWCNAKKLKSFNISGKFLIPKISLVDFLVSQYSFDITRKTWKHTLLIKGFLDRLDTIMLDPGKGFGYCRFAPQQGQLSSASRNAPFGKNGGWAV